ncbi:unnamed protein product [Mytilus edulis]|uniref:DUF7869 domain-containing protein n=1 Tax=Mytilus edulis TaxID=6550 RepID=A0A8S3T248_MYTED|nr:unnamed protein product [Mytilus edulis]
MPKTFIALFGINKNAYYSIRRRYLQGSSYTLDRKKYRKRSDKFINALIWLEEYATFRADRMPDSQTALLPYGTRRIRIYEQYHQENEKETQLKRSSFMLMWSKYLPHLKIKQTNSFSKCTTCTSIERQLEMEHDHVKRAKLMKLRAEHNDGQMAERKYYYSKRKQAVDSSSEYLSLIVDGMDQAKTALPHFVGRTAKDNKLPPILYLQADNCWRENKNKFIISFCELLVHLQIFREGSDPTNFKNMVDKFCKVFRKKWKLVHYLGVKKFLKQLIGFNQNCLNRYEEPNTSTSDQQIPNELIQMVQDETRQNEVLS